MPLSGYHYQNLPQVSFQMQKAQHHNSWNKILMFENSVHTSTLCYMMCFCQFINLSKIKLLFIFKNEKYKAWIKSHSKEWVTFIQNSCNGMEINVFFWVILTTKWFKKGPAVLSTICSKYEPKFSERIAFEMQKN